MMEKQRTKGGQRQIHVTVGAGNTNFKVIDKISSRKR